MKQPINGQWSEEKIISRLSSLKENNLIIFVSHNDKLLNKCDEKIEIEMVN